MTFLFTDIEGSTRLWEIYPDAMRRALARHDEIMRDAIESAQGVVFKTIGDAFCAAFSTASQAVQAAVQAQQSLTTETWPAGVSLNVRMALHTGEAEHRDADYFGQPVNRVARLHSIGHGGQILLSGVTKAMVANDLPAGVGLRYLGAFRLKDIEQPEELWQVSADGLPSDFPPPRSWEDLRTNLGEDLTPFVGRKSLVRQVQELLIKHRLVTLTGTGGGGKSRLAVEAARGILTRFSGGVWLIELAELNDEDEILRAMQSALGLPVAALSKGLASLAPAIGNQQMLILLDNCEHVLSPVAKIVTAVLRSTPEARFLLTSREPTGAPGEALPRVPSMELPNPDETDLEALRSNEAISLFLERAHAQAPQFALTVENAAAVVHICRTLDGIPLALELAAARIRALPPEELAKRLEDRFRLLTNTKRGDQRHQTLRATIEWSYRTITDHEREAFEQLSVFSGNWNLAHAEQVCVDPIEDFEVLDLLTTLVDKSLIHYESLGEGRYFYLETLRQFAREQLAQRPDQEHFVCRRHALAMVELTKSAFAKFRTPGEPRALAEFVEVTPNVVSALNWTKATGDANLSGWLALGLSASLQRRGYQRDGVGPLDEALAMIGDRDAELEVNLLAERATLALDLLDGDSARPLLDRAEALAAGKDELLVRIENLQGQVALSQGDFALARSRYGSALSRSEQAQNWVEMARLHNNLGIVERRDEGGDKDVAVHHYREALELQRKHGHARGEAETINSLGVLEHSRGNREAAAALYLEAAAIESNLGHTFGVAKTLSNFGEVMAELDRHQDAVKPLGIAERFFAQIRSPYTDYTRGLLMACAQALGWSSEETEDFRARCGRVNLADALTESRP